MKDGKKNGKGVCRFANGDLYEGDFVDDKQHGLGVMIFANGDKYKGEFNENRLDGTGKLEMENFCSYEGKFKDGKPCGFCKVVGPDFKYEGEYKDGVRHGKGKCEREENGVAIKEHGFFKNDKFIGETIERLKCGEQYVGDLNSSDLHFYVDEYLNYFNDDEKPECFCKLVNFQ